MATSFIRDKSLLSEGRLAGWYLDRPRAFAEPGATPVYGPDREFALASLALSLCIDPTEKTLVGEARLRIAPLSVGLGEVRLDLDELVVDSVESEEGSLDWRHADGVLRIRGLQEECTVVVRYHGRPSRGLYFVGPDEAHPHRKVQAWTQCQDEDAHFVFPCVDHPCGPRRPSLRAKVHYVGP